MIQYETDTEPVIRRVYQKVMGKGQWWCIASLINYPRPRKVSCVGNRVDRGRRATPQIFVRWSESINEKILFKI